MGGCLQCTYVQGASSTITCEQRYLQGETRRGKRVACNAANTRVERHRAAVTDEMVRTRAMRAHQKAGCSHRGNLRPGRCVFYGMECILHKITK